MPPRRNAGRFFIFVAGLQKRSHHSTCFNSTLLSIWQRFWSIRFLLIRENQHVMQPFVISMQRLLKKKLNISTPLTPQTDLKKDLDLVDWEMLYLLNAIEKKWHVSISETDQIGNVEQLLAAVKRN